MIIRYDCMYSTSTTKNEYSGVVSVIVVAPSSYNSQTFI